MKNRISLVVVILLLLFIGGYLYYEEWQYQTALDSTVSQDENIRVSFTVEKGQSVRDIAQNLFQKNVIVDSDAFIRYAREKGVDRQLKSGIYVLFPTNTIPEITDILVGKTVREVSVTIPEGYTIKQINELLKDKGIVTGQEFLECIEKCQFSFDFLKNVNTLEGFLFPETYYIDASSFRPETFINRLLTEFNNQIEPYKKDVPPEKFYDIVIMASLIERETKTNEERPIVSGILWKRLKNHWYLGVDATLRYYTNDWISSLTYQDLKDNNPYNTRTHLGLPPAPIANPGIESIKAALYPKETEYWYYLHDKEGNIHYAKTLSEHEQNKLKYIY